MSNRFTLVIIFLTECSKICFGTECKLPLQLELSRVSRLSPVAPSSPTLRFLNAVAQSCAPGSAKRRRSRTAYAWRRFVESLLRWGEPPLFQLSTLSLSCIFLMQAANRLKIAEAEAAAASASAAAAPSPWAPAPTSVPQGVQAQPADPAAGSVSRVSLNSAGAFRLGGDSRTRQAPAQTSTSGVFFMASCYHSLQLHPLSHATCDSSFQLHGHLRIDSDYGGAGGNGGGAARGLWSTEAHGESGRVVGGGGAARAPFAR